MKNIVCKKPNPYFFVVVLNLNIMLRLHRHLGSSRFLHQFALRKVCENARINILVLTIKRGAGSQEVGETIDA